MSWRRTFANEKSYQRNSFIATVLLVVSISISGSIEITWATGYSSPGLVLQKETAIDRVDNNDTMRPH